MAGKEKIGRHLTLLHGVAIIVGSIIGSGIFISPVGVILRVKSAGLSLIIWLFTGIISILGALCFAELGTTISRSGGEYIYIKEAFGNLIGFTTLWIEFFLICAIPMATSAQVFAIYFVKLFFEDCSAPGELIKLIGSAAIMLIVFINIVNIRFAARMQVVFTASKLIALAMIIILGIVHIAQGKVDNFADPFENSDYSIGSLALAFYSGFWAFGGWNNLNFLADEIINPNRNLPLSIVISILIVTTIYLMANVAYLAVLTPLEIMSSEAVAFSFFDLKVPGYGWVMPLFVSLSVFGAINGGFMCTSRIFMVGAEEGQLPRLIAMVSTKFRSPLTSLVFMCAMTLVLLFFADIFYLIELLGFAFSIVLFTTMIAHVTLRIRFPDLPRPVRMPLAMPIFLSLAFGFLVGMTVYQKPKESGLALLIILASLPVYAVCIAWKQKPKALEEFIQNGIIFMQKLFLVTDSDTKEFDEDEVKGNDEKNV